jgi:hypothetical protein
MFACYECSETYCLKCLDAHRHHTLIFFKDAYLVSNYENVNQITKAATDNPHAPVDQTITNMDVYKAKCKYSNENVLIKVIKNFTQKPPEL